MSELNKGERLDDLQIDGLEIIQNPKLYCFTSDAVLLANTVKAKKTDKVCDLCSGSGIIGILIAAKKLPASVTMVELQPKMADMARRSVLHNKLNGKIEVFNVSVQDAPKILGQGNFDTVVCNPPYQPKNSGEINGDGEVAICKTEIKLTLDELTDSAAKLLKFGGKFYLIHRADRLAEIIFSLKQNKLEPKRLTFVKPKASKTADTVIVEAVKGGKTGLTTDTLVVFKNDNTYTERVKKLYCKE